MCDAPWVLSAAGPTKGRTLQGWAPAHTLHPRRGRRLPYTGPAHRTARTATTTSIHMVPKSGVRSVRSPAAPAPRDCHGSQLYELPATSYGAPGLENYLLFCYRKSQSHVHFSTGPGALRPPHRDLSIDCKIFFCHKIGRTGRHRPQGRPCPQREALGETLFFFIFFTAAAAPTLTSTSLTGVHGTAAGGRRPRPRRWRPVISH